MASRISCSRAAATVSTRTHEQNFSHQCANTSLRVTLLSGAALQRPLYRYISRLLTRRETAEDALQEVLFRICRKIVCLRDPGLLRPWAFRIASRECFRQLRLEKRRGEEVLDLDTLETDAGETIPQEWEPSLLDWVDDLPPASRAVIVLHYLEEMTLHEVAAVLEILPGTVKSRLAYGLARLRRHTAGAQMNAAGGTHT
jgi:RNA polymerase sigma-70 factor (ECF subfamily)